MTDTTLARIADAVALDPSGCLLWQKSLHRDGYAMITRTGLGPVWVHRHLYEQAHGPIPDGMQLDHVCHTTAVQRGECAGGKTCLHRRCVHPDHLEVVTLAENHRRGARPQRTECSHGHAYDEQNTYWWRGNRKCRACHADSTRRLRAEAKAGVA